MNPPINPRTDYDLSRSNVHEFDHPLPVNLPLTFMELGYVTITPGALGLLDELNIDAHALLERFRRGDWGDKAGLADDNTRALVHGDRLMGEYHLRFDTNGRPRDTAWIICLPYDHTTILLPVED